LRVSHFGVRKTSNKRWIDNGDRKGENMTLSQREQNSLAFRNCKLQERRGNRNGKGERGEDGPKIQDEKSVVR